MGTGSTTKINVLLNFITQGQKAFLSAQGQIDTLSKNINKNNGVIAEQQQLQKQGIKEGGRVATALKAENTEYSKQRNILQSNVAGINKNMTANKKMVGMHKSVAETQKLNEIAGYSTGQVYQMNAKDLGKYREMGGKFNKTGAEMMGRFRMMTHGARGFKMEMLGVMFFGMAMKKMFEGFIKTSKNWLGVTEIMSDALGILFLPAAEQLLDWAIDFLKWVSDLSDTEKKIISWFALVGLAVGSLLYVIGTLTLGIGSMILAFNFSKVATIIGSEGLGGIKTAAGKAATKISGLKSNIGKLARYAGAAIAIGFMVKDLKAGKVVAALGDALIATGLLLPGYGKYIAVAGVVLKLFGDEEFLISTLKIMAKAGKVVTSIIKEAVLAGLGLKDFDVSNIKGFANVERAWNIAVEEMSLEDVSLHPIAPTESINKLQENYNQVFEREQAGLATTKELSTASSELIDGIERLWGEYNFASTQHDKWKEDTLKNNKEVKGNTINLHSAIGLGNRGLTKVLLDGLFSWKDKVKTTTDANQTEVNDYVKNSNIEFDKLNRTVTTTHRIVTIMENVGGGLGSAIGGVLSHVFGKKAEGGPVFSGNSYLVGEKGPEIFSPNSSGNITPNSEINGGGSNITNNFYGFTMEDLRRELDNRDSMLINEIERNK